MKQAFLRMLLDESGKSGQVDQQDKVSTVLYPLRGKERRPMR
jgi:hypothetical protein